MIVRINVTGIIGWKPRLDQSIYWGIERGVIQTAVAVKKEISKTPGPVVYPIRWASAKQRRWYFAHRAEIVYQEASRVVQTRQRGRHGARFARMRKGFGFAYRRRVDVDSKDLTRSWGVVGAGHGKAIVETNARYAPYVVGDYRQRFHAATGWPSHHGVAAQMSLSGRANKIMANEIKRAIREDFRRRP